MTDLLIISCSLNPSSKGKVLAEHTHSIAQENGFTCDLIDLQNFELPLCDGTESFNHRSVALIKEKMDQAKAILFIVPIYNYSVSASAKNVIELVYQSLFDKVIGFICTAGSPVSYLSLSSFMTSLIYDFRCHIVPKIVMADKNDFSENGAVSNQDVINRIHLLVESTVRLGRLLFPG